MQKANKTHLIAALAAALSLSLSPAVSEAAAEREALKQAAKSAYAAEANTRPDGLGYIIVERREKNNYAAEGYVIGVASGAAAAGVAGFFAVPELAQGDWRFALMLSAQAGIVGAYAAAGGGLLGRKLGRACKKSFSSALK